MKKILFALFVIISSLAHAEGECSRNPYALTTQSLVVAYDWEEKQFSSNTAHSLIGEYYFNLLKDRSCLHIEVAINEEVNCVSEEGQKILVGKIQSRVGRYSEWDFYNVNWNKLVSIKSQQTIHGCIYGIAIK